MSLDRFSKIINPMESEIKSRVRSHYDNKANITREQRASSRIFSLRKFQNWIKAMLINTYSNENCVVLDLAGGKGGDLIKWLKVGVEKYYGYDISRVSIEAALHRARNLHNCKNYFFDVFDCFGEEIEEILPSSTLYFDIVSIQFALHYSFENEERARMTLHNISIRLKPNCYAIGTIPNCYYIRKVIENNKKLSYSNSIFSITFESKINPISWSKFGLKYNFSLLDALEDCPEYVVYWKLFERLASDYGLELICRETFHKYYYNEIKKLSARKLFRDIVGVLKPYSAIMTEEEWEAAGMYCVFVLKKSNTSYNERSSFVPEYE